jgi:hypothetical protein
MLNRELPASVWEIAKLTVAYLLGVIDNAHAVIPT